MSLSVHEAIEKVSNVEITCHVPDDDDKDRRIQGIGNDLKYYEIDEAIGMIETGTQEFRVLRDPPLYDSALIVVAERNGKKYLKTEVDGKEPNNLLSLPHCRKSGSGTISN